MKPDRNAPCPCGSGRKYKKCCGAHAAAMPAGDPLQSAIQAFERGALSEAQAACEAALRRHSSNPDCQHLAGLIQAQLGHFAEARGFLERAATLAPGNAFIHSNLAMVFRELKLPDAAIDAAKRALAINPGLPEAHNNLANALKDTGNLVDAVQHYRVAVTSDPTNRQYWENLVGALLEHEELDEAETVSRSLLERFPESTVAYAGLGEVATRRDQWETAKTCLSKAIAGGSRDPRVFHNLGIVHQGLREYPQAFASFKRALAINPKLASVWYSVGQLFLLRENRPAALRAFTEAYENGLRTPEARAKLADALAMQRQVDQAHALAVPLLAEVEQCPQILPILLSIFSLACDYERLQRAWMLFDDLFKHHRLDPGSLGVSLLLGAYSEYIPENRLIDYHLAWGGQLEAGASQNLDVSEPDFDGVRLRLGYVSADFREHSVAHFFMHVLAQQDRSRFELFCYSNSRGRDKITEFIQDKVDHFVSVHDLSDDELAERIRRDGIHLLVDLSGNTSGHRLPVFARKPAPLQLTWIGYLHTTGLKTMDYRITDPYADDPTVPRGTEKLLVLPESFLCFKSFPEVAIQPEPPCVRKGTITFASFNNLMKITSAAVRLWVRVLQAVPESSLVIMAAGAGARIVADHLHAEFARHGISPERVILRAQIPREEYFAAHNDVDIILDTFPFNGGTVTAGALWMGVPVVTLVGPAHRQRVSYSMLKNIGVEETIARTEDDYVAAAVRLANDPEALAALRARIAESTRRSILCDAPRFTRQLETALRGAWDRYLAGKGTAMAEDR